MVEGAFSTHRVQTEEYVTRLVLNQNKMGDLRIGTKCLDEIIKNQVQAIEDAERAQRQTIANEKAARTKVRSEVGRRRKKALFAFPGHERGSR